MSHLGPVPHHPGHPGLAHDLPAGLNDPGGLLLALGLVVSGQGLGNPLIGAVLIDAEDDGRVPDVTDEDLAPANDGDRGRGSGGAGKARGCFGPFF